MSSSNRLVVKSPSWPSVFSRWGFWPLAAGVLALVLLAGCGKGREKAGGTGGGASAAGAKAASSATQRADSQAQRASGQRPGGSAQRPGASGQRPGGSAQRPGMSGQRPGGGREMPAVAVAVATARKGNISSFYSATATLEAEKQAQILARIQGVVSKVEAEEGEEVSEGQELMRIDNKEYLYRLRQAEANHAKLKAQYDRLENMVKQHLVSVEEFETTRSDLESAKAEEDLARLTLSYTKITAPFSGRVIERFIDLGQNVSPGNPLYTVADFHPLRARIHVPAREFRQLRRDQPVQLVLDSNGIRLRGRITLISPVIDATSGTIKVTVEIDRFPPEVRPGDFAQVKVETQQRQGRVLVPRAAVVSEKGEDVVFVAMEGRAQMQPVEVGFRDDTSAEILSGVEDGEKVVVKGQGKLRRGQPLNIVEIDGNPVFAPGAKEPQTSTKKGKRSGDRAQRAAKGSS